MIHEWVRPQRAAAYAEEALINAILDGTYQPGMALPGERELAAQLGITRPTVREALQRLSRDGWLLIRHGKPTLVTDYWREGGLNVLNALVGHEHHLPGEMIEHLLRVRLDLAPSYAREAVRHSAGPVAAWLAAAPGGAAGAEAFAQFDWELHHRLTVASGNPIYTLILNGFRSCYRPMAVRYFSLDAARAASRAYYSALAAACGSGDSAAAESITRQMMEASIGLWQRVAASATSK